MLPKLAFENAVVAAKDIRGLLTDMNDVAQSIAFQNDVNALLAACARLPVADDEPDLLPRVKAESSILPVPTMSWSWRGLFEPLFPAKRPVVRRNQPIRRAGELAAP